MAMLDNVKTLLELEFDDSKDAIISIYLANITQSIINSCNLESLPLVLEHIPVEITVKILKEDTDSIQSIKEGDTSTQFFNNLKSIPLYLKDYGDELSRFNSVVIV